MHMYIHVNVNVYLIRLDGCLAMNNKVNLIAQVGGRGEGRGSRLVWPILHALHVYCTANTYMYSVCTYVHVP